jgi:hypothetical protein
MASMLHIQGHGKSAPNHVARQGEHVELKLDTPTLVRSVRPATCGQRAGGERENPLVAVGCGLGIGGPRGRLRAGCRQPGCRQLRDKLVAL